MTLTEDEYNKQKEQFKHVQDNRDLIDIYNILIEELKRREIFLV